MPQEFNPKNVMLSDTLGKEITYAGFTTEFAQRFVSTSALVRLGKRDEMTSKMVRKSLGAGELSDAYFVDEGQKIGTAALKGKEYVLESKKIAVILPVTEEFLEYTWDRYFDEVVPAIVDKFNKKIDGAVFLGLHNNPFGTNVLAAARAANQVTTGEITTESVYDLEEVPIYHTSAFVGHRTISRGMRGLMDPVSKTAIFTKPDPNTRVGSLDSTNYVELDLGLKPDGVTPEEYPEGTLIAGDFSFLRYGIPQGANLRLKIADQATLSKVQNAGPDSGDVHLFEQDMQALRAVFEIAVAIPEGVKAFAAIEKTPGV